MLILAESLLTCFPVGQLARDSAVGPRIVVDCCSVPTAAHDVIDEVGTKSIHACVDAQLT